MPLTEKITALNRRTLLFPLALVLFEFAVYIGNDMAQPAMLMVTREFGVSAAWTPVSMTAYLLGGASLAWFTGPLSDRVGRRPVMLGGVLYFLLTCLATYFVHSIEAFIALRVLQGIGLCFIGSVGYATVQESFEEVSAVRVTALMANVALIAPMVGPLAGATLVNLAPWRSCFLFIATIALIALIGLWLRMPETVRAHTAKAPYSQILHDYLGLFAERRFVRAALSMALISMSLIGWIAMSPVLLVEQFGCDLTGYGLWQVPVFGALIVGNLLVFAIAGRWQLGRSVLIGYWPMAAGMLCTLVTLLHPSSPVFIVLGVSLMAFAEGLSIAVLYRFAMTASTHAKGTVAAGLAMLAMICYAIGTEITRIAEVGWGVAGFVWAMALMPVAYLLVSRGSVRHEMHERDLGLIKD